GTGGGHARRDGERWRVRAAGPLIPGRACPAHGRKRGDRGDGERAPAGGGGAGGREAVAGADRGRGGGGEGGRDLQGAVGVCAVHVGVDGAAEGGDDRAPWDEQPREGEGGRVGVGERGRSWAECAGLVRHLDLADADAVGERGPGGSDGGRGGGR